MSIRVNLKIEGQVQGVGFRPFVYKLANKLNLAGFVKNSINGVVIEIEGIEENIKSFENLLISDLPPLARINKIKKKNLNTLYNGEFEIRESCFETPTSKTASVSPDIAICRDCLLDINSFYKNNYFQYFATNCTNCGPRYSIIKTVPYDRANTSMKKFTMCKLCDYKYKNPLDRRYHAQPISCNSCGPTLKLIVKSKELIVDRNKIFKKVANFIKEGKIGAIKGIGGFHIVCDAFSDKAINNLRDHKNRPTKPFAIMCKNLEQIKSCANVNKKEEELLTSKEAPIVILKRIHNSTLKIQHSIAPAIDRIGCFLPYTALHHLLFKYLNNPIIATSANIADEPIITTREQIEQKLTFIDFILDYDRDIVNAVDDSLVQVINSDIQTLRLARGYAPKEIKLPFKLDKKILAVGANQKNSIALAFDDKIIISPYIGDLNNLKSFEFFKRTLETFKRFYDFEPDIIVHDKHPTYETTKWAKELKIKNKELKIFEVQHHIAHLYSVKAEYSQILNSSFSTLNFIFDGTGYGDDGTLWGGEVFIGDERKYSFKPIKLLGGEKAIKEPRRVALSMLFDKLSLEEVLNLDLDVVKSFSQSEIKILHQSFVKNLNCPKSSSVGRLFDAMASFANICQFQSYEGETGLLCETAYNFKIKEYFEYEIIDGVIDIKIVDFIIKYQNIKDKTLFSTMFINTLVQIILEISKKEKLEVILSGGVFQNKTLLELVTNKLEQENIKYYYNKETPINDGGIALGQIYYTLSSRSTT